MALNEELRGEELEIPLETPPPSRRFNVTVRYSPGDPIVPPIFAILLTCA